MKTILYTIILLSISTNIISQDQYTQGMAKAFELWGENKTMEASGMFERIAQVEADNWIPPYYAANALIVGSFQTKDKVLVNEMLEKAKTFIAEAHKRSPENSEITTMEGLLYTGYVAMAPETYAMQYSDKIMNLHTTAKELDPSNPRAQYNSIEYEIGGAKFFKTDLSAFCEKIEKVRPLFEQQKSAEAFAPSYGIDRLEATYIECGCKTDK